MNIIPHGAKETFCEAKLICVCCGCVCVYLSRLFILPKLYSIWLFIFTFLELPLGVFLHPVQSFNYFYQFVVFTLKHTEYSVFVVIKITMGGVMMWLLFTLTVTRICIDFTEKNMNIYHYNFPNFYCSYILYIILVDCFICPS